MSIQPTVVNQTVTQKINPSSRCAELGIPISRGGVITLDAYIYDSQDNQEYFKAIMVETGGTVVIENPDGTPIAFPIPDRGIRYFLGARVLTSATIEGQTYTTDAEGIFWGGGK